jgi:PhzF family phenazine biosynthesis protein
VTRLPIYQVDAFASRVFAGNPAAVVPLSGWLDDATLQGIAAENNLSETAFLVGGKGDYEIRWFTPQVEVDLCGHATLASGWVVLERLERGRAAVRFRTREAGDLRVERDGELLSLELPSRPPRRVEPPPGLAEALGAEPRETWAAKKLMAVFDDPEVVRGLRPDLVYVARLERDGLVVTAPGRGCDFVSRYFAPHAGIPEDPVTGSAHSTLVPYWAARLKKQVLEARQVSARGGELRCALLGDRVRLAGRVAPYLEGTIEVP